MCTRRDELLCLALSLSEARRSSAGSNGPQKFCIERVNATDGLARAHTCFNRLDLPMYATIELMGDRLTFAMDNTAGFSQE